MFKVVSEEEYNRFKNLLVIKKGSHWYYDENTAMQYFRKSGKYYVLKVDENNLQYIFVNLLGASDFKTTKGIEYNKEIPFNIVTVVNSGIKQTRRQNV